MSNRTLLSSSVSMGVIVLFALSGNAFAQETKTKANETVIVTGSSIKRKVLDSALPLQIISQEEIKREGISSPEQLISLLNSNGNGLDNLASNADVVSGAQRGNNGASSANLRGQGNGATLVLLNGRRVAAHGLNGGSVDVNQIPMAAIERVDILKDGASAIYGTDAIGGVINFITKKNVKGVTLNVFGDKTEDGGGDIYKASLTGGFGDLDKDNFNIMGVYSYSDAKMLKATQRDFINTFQPDRGLSPDTRGTPFATIVPLNGSFLTSGNTGNAPLVPVSGLPNTQVDFGINNLALPGNLGCSAIAGMGDYDEKLWSPNITTVAKRQFACAYDTGKPAVLQQPLKTKNYLVRGVYRFGQHELTAEYTGSDADALKQFSENQITANTTTANFLYPLNATTKPVYDRIYNQLIAAFPTLGVPSSQYGKGLAVRWRCMECGPRQIETFTKTSRTMIGLDGPLGSDWNYRFGASYAESKSHSVLGNGYYYSYDTVARGCTGANKGLMCVLNSGLVNMFLLPGEQQSAAALSAIAATSAKGTVLYGGKATVKEVDGSASGPIFSLPGGMAYAAVGFDLRQESYQLDGDTRPVAEQREIYNAPFDNSWALTPKTRDVNAIFAEFDFPLFTGFDLTIAGRMDDYQGFGTTTNPKISVKYRPIKQVLFRGSYNTGFRVPSFKQVYDTSIQSPYTSATYADPKICAGGVPTGAPGCSAITFVYLTGGRSDLGPETSKQESLGVVFTPIKNYSLSFDWWKIDTTGSIGILTLTDLFKNYALFEDRFTRDSSGAIIEVDQRYVNAGESLTQGLEVAFRGRNDVYGGSLSYGLDGTKLLEKKTRAIASLPLVNQLGVWSLAGDLGLRWKHNAFVSFSKGAWTGTLSQIYRSGYVDQFTPIAGLAAGLAVAPNWKPKVDSYTIYNASVSYKGFKNFSITGGIKNLLNTDPPFALSYDTGNGSGSSWEPRVADPRGRSYTLSMEYKF